MKPELSRAVDSCQVLDGEVITVEGKMNELESRRKAFQNIGSEVRAVGLCEIAQKVQEGTLHVACHGPPTAD